jgi:hypothetical protein
MPQKPPTNPSPAQDEQIFYEIKVTGRIDPQRAEWLGDLKLALEQPAPGKTLSVLRGALPDQAALFGVLCRIRDLGLRLASVNSSDQPAAGAGGLLGGSRPGCEPEKNDSQEV